MVLWERSLILEGAVPGNNNNIEVRPMLVVYILLRTLSLVLKTKVFCLFFGLFPKRTILYAII